MFRFIKALLFVAALAGLAYAFFFVPLDERTFFEHLVGISKTEEAKDLGNAIETKADHLKTEVIKRIPGKSDLTSPSSVKKLEKTNSLSELTDEDRKALLELIREKQEH